MFVSVVLDPGGSDSAHELVTALSQAGFKKMQRGCWEHMDMSEPAVTELKKSIDRVTDYYDCVRLYQFPLNGMFVLTELKQKKWRRCQMRAPEEHCGTSSAAKAGEARGARQKNEPKPSSKPHAATQKSAAPSPQ